MLAGLVYNGLGSLNIPQSILFYGFSGYCILIFMIIYIDSQFNLRRDSFIIFHIEIFSLFILIHFIFLLVAAMVVNFFLFLLLACQYPGGLAANSHYVSRKSATSQEGKTLEEEEEISNVVIHNSLANNNSTSRPILQRRSSN